MRPLIPLSAGKGIDPGAQLAEIYYDLAGFVTEGTLAGILDLAPSSQLVCGSDWPFTPTPIIAGLAIRLETFSQLDAEARDAMRWGNALRLFPRLDARWRAHIAAHRV